MRITQSVINKILTFVSIVLVTYSATIIISRHSNKSIIDVPQGKWVLLYSDETSVVQIDVSRVTNDSFIRFWVREDLISKKIIFTDIEVNCLTGYIKIHERLEFSPNLKFVNYIDLISNKDTEMLAASFALCKTDSKNLV